MPSVIVTDGATFSTAGHLTGPTPRSPMHTYELASIAKATRGFIVNIESPMPTTTNVPQAFGGFPLAQLQWQQRQCRVCVCSQPGFFDSVQSLTTCKLVGC